MLGYRLEIVLGCIIRLIGCFPDLALITSRSREKKSALLAGA
jgi:hypothetical protein